MIKRTLTEHIISDFGKGKVIVLLGARQVGKTTLLEQMQGLYPKQLFLNCDNGDDRLSLEDKSSTELSRLLSPYDVVFIDEAQKVKNIGLILKMIADLKLKTQVLATGSSALELSNEVNEPATGRLIEYKIFPLSYGELFEESSSREERRLLESRMIYGMYPEVVTTPNDARRILMTLSDNYLYKDIFSYKGIKKPDLLYKLVRALALQVGDEVSYNELSNLLGIDKVTVESYIGLLEKCYILFRVESYSGNMRNEIKKGKKVYFYDNGIRNAVISNFSPLELRNDVGALWENLMVSERVKRNAYKQNYAKIYFWRNFSNQEVDLLEEQDGRLSAFEFKWNRSAKAKVPRAFAENYPNIPFEVITPTNFEFFVGDDRSR